MATGYEDDRFGTIVDDDLHCAICRKVLKDPVQCRRNEHHFCRNCISEHLSHSRNCPTCKEPLTVETLARCQRFLAKSLSRLMISCDNSQRGCRAIVELGSLNAHVASCDFSSVPCPNDQCDEIETEMGGVRSTKGKIARMVQNTMTSVAKLKRNAAQRFEGSHVCSGQELHAKIVVAGGFECRSVEVFNITTKTWQPMSEMKECRYRSSAVLYKGRMIVTGSSVGLLQDLDSVEELNLTQQDEHWVESKFKLPVPSFGHACVVYQDCLFVIGGCAIGRVLDTIYAIQLTPPHMYASWLVTRMPKPLCGHGAEMVNDKILIIGGRTTGSSEDATNTVLMFDPATKTCTELKPLLYRVSRMATVTWKCNVVGLGGEDNQGNILKTVMLHNVTTGSRRMLPEMTTERSGCTAVIIGNNIIIMGGCDKTSTALKSVECFNLVTNKWTEFPAMIETRDDATAVVKYC